MANILITNTATRVKFLFGEEATRFTGDADYLHIIRVILTKDAKEVEVTGRDEQIYFLSIDGIGESMKVDKVNEIATTTNTALASDLSDMI